MWRHRRDTNRVSVRRGLRIAKHDHKTARWGLVLVVGGWTGVGLTHLISRTSGDLSSRSAAMWTAGPAIASLAAIWRGVAIAINATLSPMRFVFHSRRTAWVAALLLAAAAIEIASLRFRAPFEGISAHGKPLAELISDLAYIAASLICLVGGCVALRAALDARRHERDWQR